MVTTFSRASGVSFQGADVDESESSESGGVRGYTSSGREGSKRLSDGLGEDMQSRTTLGQVLKKPMRS